MRCKCCNQIITFPRTNDYTKLLDDMCLSCLSVSMKSAKWHDYHQDDADELVDYVIKLVNEYRLRQDKNNSEVIKET